MFDLQSINVWGTVAAALAMFALGGLWFSPALFGRQWMESAKSSPREVGSPAVAFALFLITSVGISFLVALLFSAAGMDTTGKGLAGGALLAVLFFLVSLGDAGFTGHLRSKWWWIQVSYRVVGTLLVCAIVGASAPRSPAQEIGDTVDRAGKGLQKAIEDIGRK